MPTITLICNEYPPIIMGGIGNTARVLAKNYSKIKDLKVNVITSRYNENKDLPRFEQKENLAIYRIKAPAWLETIIGKIYKKNLCFPFYVGLFSLFKRKLIKNSDLVHSLHVRDASFLLKCKKPLILNLSDVYGYLVPKNPFKYPFDEKGKFLKYLNHMWFRIIDYAAMKKADAVLNSCVYSKEICEKIYPFSKGRTNVVYKGTDFPSLDDMPEKEIDIIFIGSRFEIKGAKEVLFAVNILKDKYPGIKCLMIGRYSKFDYDYEKFIKDNNLQKNITILGNTPHDKIFEYLKKSRIYVNPTHLEMYSHTLVEAMTVKLPVISSDVGGNPEIVQNGENGFLIKSTDYNSLAEHIDFLLKNPAIAKKMGEKGYKKVKEGFSETYMVGKYIELYNQFLPENKKISV